MNVGGIVAIAFLVVMVALILWNIRGHGSRGNMDGGLDHIGRSGADSVDGGGGP